MDFHNLILGAPVNSENDLNVDELEGEEGELEEEETDDHWIIRTLLDDIINYVCHVHDDDDLEEEEWCEEIYSCTSCSEITSSTETVLSSECIDARILNWKLWLCRHEAQIQKIIKKTRRPICEVLMANLDEVYRIFMVKQILNDAEREKNWNVLFWKFPEHLKCIPNKPQVYAPFPKSETCDKPLELIDLPSKDLCERRLRKQSWLMSKYLEEKLRKMNIKLPNFDDLEITGTNIKKREADSSTLESFLASTEPFGEEEEGEDYGQLNFEEEIDCITFQLRANEKFLCGRHNNIEINFAYETSQPDRQMQTVKFENLGRIAIRFNFKKIHPPYDVFYYNQNTFKLIPNQCRDFDIFFQPTEYGIYTEHIEIEMNSSNSVTINLFGFCSVDIPELRAELEQLENEMQNEISKVIVKNRLEQIIQKADPRQYYVKNYEIILTPENLWNLKNPQFEYDLEIADSYIMLYNDLHEIPINLKNCNKWDYDLEKLYATILQVEDEEKRYDLYSRFCTNYERMRLVKRLPLNRNDEKMFKVRILLVSLFDTFEKIALDLKMATQQSPIDLNEEEREVGEEENLLVLYKCDLDRDSCQNIEVDADELNKSKYAIYLQSLQLKTFHLLYTAIDDIVNAIESSNIRN